MNTVFARVLLAISLVSLPASALASTKGAKTDKAKHETKADHTKHGHSHATIAKKGQPAKKAKHHGHDTSDDKAVAAFSASKAR